jgi:hypothetical protein
VADAPGMRQRSVDQAQHPRVHAPVIAADVIRAGLASGSYIRGVTSREATGDGAMPVVGDLLLPGQVGRIEPPLGRGQFAACWEVTGLGRARDGSWTVPVVGIRDAG